ncbi:MAG: class I SAM-dependent methyltransferase, partial [Tissierellia bacterium]|nr:class I SAM-dependent methyltransferase [Tissierellia bacterium]
ENKSKLLSKNNKFYIGDSFLNSFNMMSLEEAVDLVKNGSDEYKANDKKVALYDFKAMAKASANEIKLFRAKALIDKIKKIYDEDVQFKFLDLGGGSGMMSIELAKAFPNSKGVVFDDPDVLEIAKEFILDENMEDRIEIIGGDFLTDDIGSGYDLIIACGVFHFAKSSLDNFFEKIYNALKADGFLCSKTFTVSDDYLKPERFFTRWLSSHLRGTSSLLTSEFLEKSISKKFIEHLETKDNRDFRIHKKR